MSTKDHRGHGSENGGLPVHGDVTFEERDINVGTVVKQLIYLGITIVVALLICIPILKFLTGMAAESDTPMAPVRAEMSQEAREQQAMPPEPRLQGVPGHEADPQQDLRDKIEADTKANQSFGWVDKANGIAKIPVKDAMKILAGKSGSVARAAAQEKKQ
jgi:hypothetical protein